MLRNSLFQTPSSIPKLTYNNHFKWGYDDSWYAPRQSANNVWNVAYGRCTRHPRNLREEIKLTCALIRDTTDLPLVVMASGGIDSELIMRGFRDAGIPFEAATMRYKGGYNAHDIKWATDYCHAFNVPQRFYDLDIEAFWSKDGLVYEYAEGAKSISPQTCTTMWLMDQIEGFPILGQGEPYLWKEIRSDYEPWKSEYLKSPWYMWEREFIVGWYRHLTLRNRDGAPGFFQYTPELMWAYLTDPIMVDLVNDRIVGKLSTFTVKPMLYQSHYPGLEERTKYNGHELLIAQDRAIRAVLREKYKDYAEVYNIEYNELLDCLRYDGEEEPMPDKPQITPNYPRYRKPFALDHSRDGHLTWKYETGPENGGGSTVYRQHASDTFKVSYARSGGLTVPLRVAIEQELFLLWHQCNQKLAFHYTRSITSEIILKAIRALGIKVEIIMTPLCQTVPEAYSKPRGMRLEWVTLDQLTTFMYNMAKVARVKDPMMAYNAYVGTLTDKPVIYDGCANRLVNFHYDLTLGKAFGEPNWYLVDNERNFAIARWLIATGRQGYPFFMKHSPIMIKAHFSEPKFKEWFDANQNVRNNAHNEIDVYKSLYKKVPNRDYFTNALSYYQEWVDTRKTRFNEMYPDCEAQSKMPWAEVKDTFSL